MVVNIPKNLTAGELSNGYKIRRAAIDLNVPLITNARLASAFINAFCRLPHTEEEYPAFYRYTETEGGNAFRCPSASAKRV